MTQNIDDMLVTLNKVWNNNPQMRLGQMMYHVVAGDKNRLHGIEDKEVAKLLVELFHDKSTPLEEDNDV